MGGGVGEVGDCHIRKALHRIPILGIIVVLPRSLDTCHNVALIISNSSNTNN